MFYDPTQPFETRQKVFLAIYLVLGLPALPLVLLAWPLAQWAVSSPPRPWKDILKLFTTPWGWLELASVSIALTFTASLFAIPLYLLK